MTNYTIRNNEQFGSKEIYFEAKPTSAEREALKGLKFRWNGKKICWYGFAEAEQISAALNGSPTPGSRSEHKKEAKSGAVIDLFALTRTDNIPDHFSLYRIYNNKEIAANIRKHLRGRFPFCKWSVTSDRYSIGLTLKAAPFDAESAEAAAIAHYAYIYAESFNYDNSDSYTDYFDVNFYGVYESNIIERDYIKTESAEAVAISALFTEKAAEAEQKQREKEAEEEARRREEEKQAAAEYAKREAQRKKNHEIIENNHVVKDVDFFALDVIAPHLNKQDSLNDITELLSNPAECYRDNCKVSKAVYFTENVYNLFINQLLDDYTFLANMGGTSTDDYRISTFYDYQKMTKEEKETVEFYNSKCVAIYSDSVLKLMIDPQGYSYARYTFVFDEKSRKSEDYKPSTGVNEEDHAAAVEAARILEDISTEIITSNNLFDVWNTTEFNLYCDLLKAEITKYGLTFSRLVIQSVEIDDLKKALYRFYDVFFEICEQLNRAGVQFGQHLTICYFSGFGELVTEQVKLIDYSMTKYAQHENAAKINYKPKNKKNVYFRYFYDNIIIFDGWHDIPRDVLYTVETKETEYGTITTAKSKYLSCDKAQFDEITNYFEKNNIYPIVNTYKPETIATIQRVN